MAIIVCCVIVSKLFNQFFWRSILCRCVVDVKSFDRDNISSASSSDYEKPDDASVAGDDVTSPRAAAADDDGDDDEYEVCDEIPEPPPPNRRPAPTTTTTTPAAAVRNNAEPDDDDLIYESCDDVVTPSRDPVTSQPDTVADEDCANMYYGRWDHVADNDKELSFKHGDMLVIVSRQYDDFGWWVGRLNGIVGLVPRDYLTPAYELVET